MKKIFTLIFAITVVFTFTSHAQQNVGIGTTNPLQKLEIGGTSNTLRIDGIGTGGSFLTAPNSTSSTLLYANSLGDVSSIPAGSTGNVLSINGSGLIQWQTPTTLSAGTGINIAGNTINSFWTSGTGSNSNTYIYSNNAVVSPLGNTAGAGSVGIGTGGAPNTTLDVNGSIAFREGTAIALVNGTNNNVATQAGNSWVRITGPTGAFTITGINRGYDGKIINIYNTTSQPVTIVTAANSASVVTNQILTNTGANVTFQGPNVLQFQYNATLGDWILLSGGNSGWALNGNASTAPDNSLTGNFVGTTDANPLSFRVNNLHAGYIDNVGDVFLGSSAGNYGAGSTKNTYLGFGTGALNATSSNNVGIGYNADITSTASTNNTSVGALAYEFGTGSNNIAVGYSALTGVSGSSPFTGSNMTVIGVNSGVKASSASNSVYVGNNIASGSTTSASGANNVFVGYNAAMVVNGALQNVFVGASAGAATAGSANTNNVYLGYSAGAAETSTNSNTFVGASAGSGATSASNVFVGTSTGAATTGASNVYVGAGTGAAATSGGTNVFVGAATGTAIVTGSNNVLLGAGSGTSMTGGAGNVFVGPGTGTVTSGAAITTGTNNTYVGNSAGAASGGAAFTNSSAIGNAAAATASNQVILGNHSVTQTGFNGALMPYYSSAYNAGTSGQVLTSQGPNVAPQWANASGGGWALTGNSGTTSDFGLAGNFIGTTDAGTSGGLGFRVNNARAGFIDNAGSQSVFLGCLSGNYGTWGTFTPAPASFENVYIGYHAGTSNGSASAQAPGNVGIGWNADASTTTGAGNTSMGWSAFQNQTGSDNVAIGYEALQGPSTFLGGPGSSAFNVALGYTAGLAVTSGQYNTILGEAAAPNITTGSRNVLIGNGAGTTALGGTNGAALNDHLVIESTKSTGLWNSATAPVLLSGNFAAATIGLEHAVTHDAEYGTTSFNGHLDVQAGMTGTGAAQGSNNMLASTATFTTFTDGTVAVANNSTDVSGTVSVTVNTATGTGSATFTFGHAYSTAPFVTLTPANLTAAAGVNYWVSSTTTGFTINFTGVAGTYAFNYFAVETTK